MSHDAPPRPLVSVIVATYNRSNILRFTIETVRRQTVTDWELLVVGDGCTDDTAEVVAATNDPRVRFWNLAAPAGEQTGPNNAGVEAARGRYLAFLNHDDFWLPKHLERAVKRLEREAGLDLVYGLNLAVYPDGSRVVWGSSNKGTFPEPGVPASSWVLRRALAERVGPWRFARESYLVPSQDWMARARRSGAQVALVPRLSTLSFPSSSRKGSYSERASEEHAAWFARLTNDPSFPEDVLCEALIDRDLSSWRAGNSLDVWPHVRRAGINALKRALLAAGVSPTAAAFWWRYKRRGGFVAHARRVRGLPAKN